MADDFLQRFMAYQESRDHEQERRDYEASTRVRLFAANGAEAHRWRLDALPGLDSGHDFYTVVWRGKHYRINAIAPIGIVDDVPAEGMKNEILAHEITDEDPLRGYERDAVPYQLPEE